MPTVYLSPSTQEYNTYVTGNSEEYYANLIVDAMIPYLRASGIDFVRNDPGGTVASVDFSATEIQVHRASGKTDVIKL